MLSLGLAKRLAKKGDANGHKSYNRKRKRHSFSRTLSDSETDELLESLSFPDQPGDIEGEKTQSKITSCTTPNRLQFYVLLQLGSNRCWELICIQILLFLWVAKNRYEANLKNIFTKIFLQKYFYNK